MVESQPRKLELHSHSTIQFIFSNRNKLGRDHDLIRGLVAYTESDFCFPRALITPTRHEYLRQIMGTKFRVFYQRLKINSCVVFLFGKRVHGYTLYCAQSVHVHIYTPVAIYRVIEQQPVINYHQNLWPCGSRLLINCCFGRLLSVSAEPYCAPLVQCLSPNAALYKRN